MDEPVSGRDANVKQFTHYFSSDTVVQAQVRLENCARKDPNHNICEEAFKVKRKYNMQNQDALVTKIERKKQSNIKGREEGRNIGIVETLLKTYKEHWQP